MMKRRSKPREESSLESTIGRQARVELELESALLLSCNSKPQPKQIFRPAGTAVKQ